MDTTDLEHDVEVYREQEHRVRDELRTLHRQCEEVSHRGNEGKGIVAFSLGCRPVYHH